MNRQTEHQTRLFYALLSAFIAWLAFIFAYLLPKVLAQPTLIDPVMGLLTGLGLGAITQFFMLLLKDGWQYFFRKKPPQEKKDATVT